MRWKGILISVSILVFVCAWFLVLEIYIAKISFVSPIAFEIKRSESAVSIAERLQTKGVIKSQKLFLAYVKLSKKDRQIQSGTIIFTEPLTLAHVVDSLTNSSAEEMTITIIPGWTLRNIAEYLENKGIGSKEEFMRLAGTSATFRAGEFDISPKPKVLNGKPKLISLEGYLRPDTYRVYDNVTVDGVLTLLVQSRDEQFTDEIYSKIQKANRTVHEVLTVASIVEREVQSEEDKKKVADIFWKRVDAGMGLQADSTVHYISGKTGDVFTTSVDRASENHWNTYRWRGLPPGPISNPSLNTILATITPEKNDYWFFLTTADGTVKYAKTLDEHNRNVQKFLR